MENSKELDFSSEEFDALKALTNPETVVPIPGAVVYDNLGQFVAAVRNKGKSSDGKITTRPKQLGNEKIERQFTAEQGPIMGRGRHRPLRNVLTRMDEVTKGPLAVLRSCMVNRTRVKVWIRGPAWIRGYCVGYVAAFDKQWNLALTDVDETFTRVRHRKTPVYGPVEQSLCHLDISQEDEVEKTDDQTESAIEREDSGSNMSPSTQVVDVTSVKKKQKGMKPEMNEDEACRSISECDRNVFEAIATTGSDHDTYRTETNRLAEISCWSSARKNHGERWTNIYKATSSLCTVASGDSLDKEFSSNIGIPAESLTGTIVQEVHRRYELCQRHIHQLFIRGEQIVLVAVLDP